MVTLDADGGLVRDALLWNDTRSAPDAADLIAELGGPQAWADAVGTVPVASMTITKLRWLAAVGARAGRAGRLGGPPARLPDLGARRAVVRAGHRPRRRVGHPATSTPATDTYRDDLVRPRLRSDRSTCPASPLRRRSSGTPPTASRSRRARATTWPPASGWGSSRARRSSPSAPAAPPSPARTTPTHEPTGTVAGFADATGEFLPLVCTLNGARNLVATAEVLGVTPRRARPPGADGAAGQRWPRVPALPRGRAHPAPCPSAKGELVGLTAVEHEAGQPRSRGDRGRAVEPRVRGRRPPGPDRRRSRPSPSPVGPRSRRPYAASRPASSACRWS